MTTPLPTRTGARILVDQLLIHDVELGFCVPGESYLAVLDALYDVRERLRLIVCRHEAAAANMAEAYGKLTGRPGIAFVSRGPGATHASIGLHTAFQDSTPLVLFIGQIARDTVDREAFQEIDYRRFLGQVTKWVGEINDPRRIPEYVSHAFQLACAGRPGPVALVLPEDMLTEPVAVADARPYVRVQAAPAAADMTALRSLLAAAKRPLMIVGGPTWNEEAGADIVAFAEANNLPTGCSFRAQDIFDNTHRNFVGDIGVAVNPKLAERVKAADLILAAGPRLGEATTSGYTLLEVPRPHQKLIHIHPGADELGRVYQPDLAILSGLPAFAAAARALAPVDSSAWADWAAAARSDYEANRQVPQIPGALNLAEVVLHLARTLPPEAILTNGAGNYAVWVHRFYQHRRYRTQLGPTSGAMGYGVPAAIAAKLVHPDRPVVCFSGDGCFLMSGQELATAIQYRLPIVFIVFNNGMYGTIRMHQEREFPARVHGSDLTNPDFAAYARSFGAMGEVVERTEDFAPAFARALQAAGPALIELRPDPEALTPRASLSEIRARALAARAQ